MPTLNSDRFELHDQVGIVGTDLIAVIIRRMPHLCADCGHPIYVVDTADGDRFAACEPNLLRLRPN
jgi:hypothetical protein